MIEEKKILDLGERQGRLLFFGGVYGNLQSLQQLQSWAQQQGFATENIFCTGDILGYCAQPVECINLIREWSVHSIAGNVELQLRSGAAHCGCDFKTGGRCDLFSQNWYTYLQKQVTGEALEWLHTLPHHIQITIGRKKCTIIHGSWFNTSEFIFGSTPWAVKAENFSATNSDLIVAGHCGLPFAHAHENKLWLNAGVIGMPANDGTSRVWAATLKATNGSIHHAFHHYQYDHHTAALLMQEQGLPHSYARTLSTGIWDNCEVLPPEETGMQGKAIGLTPVIL